MSPQFNSRTLTLILLLFTSCKSSSLDNDIICDMKWKGGGVLENAAQSQNISLKCLETNMFDDRELMEKLAVNTTLEEFVKFDDNCYSQCAYKAENVLAQDGTINRNETEKQFKGNLTQDVAKQAITIWNDCITEAERVAKTTNVNNCKMIALHDFCFSKKAMQADLFKIECVHVKPSS